VVALAVYGIPLGKYIVPHSTPHHLDLSIYPFPYINISKLYQQQTTNNITFPQTYLKLPLITSHLSNFTSLALFSLHLTSPHFSPSFFESPDFHIPNSQISFFGLGFWFWRALTSAKRPDSSLPFSRRFLPLAKKDSDFEGVVVGGEGKLGRLEG
jgi:hypothetical protein